MGIVKQHHLLIYFSPFHSAKQEVTFIIIKHTAGGPGPTPVPLYYYYRIEFAHKYLVD